MGSLNRLGLALMLMGIYSATCAVITRSAGPLIFGSICMLAGFFSLATKRPR